MAEKIAEHENTPEIFRIIKRNYEILKKAYPNPMKDNENGMIDSPLLKQKGFNPKFFTSVLIDAGGQPWHCVFEMGFITGDKSTLVKDFPQQAQP
ncbi:hypothetical protein [Pedobacter paludis]|nr:hypothetical protein [Pedobacter paludis]